MRTKIGIFILFTFFYFGIAMNIYAALPINIGDTTAIIRIHVIAKSNSAYDQALKIKVKNAVLAKMKKEIGQGRDIETTKKILQKNLQKIEEIAKKTLEKNDNYDSVQVLIGKKHYEKRILGNIEVQEGDYESLRIIIGAGQGNNWWGILYPNLCFNDAVTNADMKTLQKEYNNIKKDKTQKRQVKIKWKILEIFK